MEFRTTALHDEEAVRPDICSSFVKLKILILKLVHFVNIIFNNSITIKSQQSLLNQNKGHFELAAEECGEVT